MQPDELEFSVAARDRIPATLAHWTASLRRSRFLTRFSPATWAWIALAVMLVAGGILFVHDTRGTTFFADEWTWILYRRPGTLDSFLQPHNEHLSLVPVAIYKLLFATAGLRHYAPYRAVVIGAHLACGLLVFVYAKPRVGGFFALSAAALILFFGPGWQNILWPFQMAWLFAIAAGVGALLMLDRGDRVGDAGACLLLGVSLGSAGPGLAISVGLVVEVLQRRRWRDLWIVVIPLGLYALWWVSYQHTIFVPHAILLVPRFVFDAAAGALSALAGLSGVNVQNGNGDFLNWGPPLLAIALIGLGWRLRRLGRVPTRVLTLIAMVLSFWVLTGVARSYVPIGGIVLTATGDESRYLYVGAVLIVLLAVELARGIRSPLVVTATIGVLTTAAVISNLGPFGDAAQVLRSAAQVTDSDLGTLDLTRQIVNASFSSAGFIFGGVEAGPYFAAERALGSPGASAAQIAAEPEAVRMGADSQLIAIHQVTFQPVGSAPRGQPGRPTRPAPLGAPPNVDAVEAGTVSVRGACDIYRPAAFTPAQAASALQLTVPAAGLVVTARVGPATVELRRFARQFQQLGTIAAFSPVVLRIMPDGASQLWHVRIAAAGGAEVCGL